MADTGPKPRHLIHDRDGAFLPLDGVLRADGVIGHQNAAQAPMCNAYAERFVQECHETLDNPILLGGPHLYHVLKRIEHHHNRQRPHQGIANVVPIGFEYPAEPVSVQQVRCESTLGGLLNHYYAEQAA